MSCPSGTSLDAVFARDVVPAVFGEGRSSERPLTLWIGGQPGSGKTFGARPCCGCWERKQWLG